MKKRLLTSTLLAALALFAMPIGAWGDDVNEVYDFKTWGKASFTSSRSTDAIISTSGQTVYLETGSYGDHSLNSRFACESGVGLASDASGLLTSNDKRKVLSIQGLKQGMCVIVEHTGEDSSNSKYVYIRSKNVNYNQSGTVTAITTAGQAGKEDAGEKLVSGTRYVIQSEGSFDFYRNENSYRIQKVTITDQLSLSLTDDISNISFQNASGESITTAKYGETVTIVPNSGYTITGNVAINGETVSPTAGAYTFTMPAADVVVTSAECSALSSYTITDNSGSNGSVITDQTSAIEGATITLTVTPDAGYWLKDGTLKVNGGDVTLIDNTFTMPAGNVTITADFEAVSPIGEYDFQTWAKGTDYITDTGNNIYDLEQNSNKVLTGRIKKSDGYYTRVLPLNGVFGATNTSVQIRKNTTATSNGLIVQGGKSSDLTIYNLKAGNTLNVTWTSSNASPISVTSGKVKAFGSSDDVTSIVSGTDYIVQEDGNLALTITSASGTPTHINKIVVGNSYALTIAAPTDGTIKATVDGTEYATGAYILRGKTVTLTATPNSGYQLNGWTDGSGSDLGTLPKSLVNSFTMTGSTTVNASFESVPTLAAVSTATTWTFDGFATNTILSDKTVYGYNNGSGTIYISGHNSGGSNQATVKSGSSVTTGISDDVKNYIYFYGNQNTALKHNRTSDQFTPDALAFKTGSAGKVSVYAKAATGNYINIYEAIGTTANASSTDANKYQTATTGEGQTASHYIVKNANVFIGSNASQAQFYAVKFEPETVSKPTIAQSGNTVTITPGTSSFDGNDGVSVTTYYTIDGSDPSSSSTEYTEPFSITANCMVKAITISSGGTSSTVAEQSCTYTATESALTISSPLTGGSVTATVDGTAVASTVAAGTEVTLTVKPNSGYQLKTLTVKNAAKEDITYTTNNNLEYKFKMPSSAVSVNAEFEEEVKISTLTTWTFDDTTAYPTSEVRGIRVNNGLYMRSKSDGGGRNFKFASSDEATAMKFSNDNVEFTPTRMAIATGTGAINKTISTAGGFGSSAAVSDAIPFFAFNTSVPGTVYALVKGLAKGSSNSNNKASDKTSKCRIYFVSGTTKVGDSNTNLINKEGTDEVIELKATATEAGSFFIGSMDNACQIYAIRFVPTPQYAINIGTMTGDGTVTADAEKAIKGATVTLTVAAGTDKELKEGSLKVTYGSGSTATLTKTDATHYTFAMPEADVTVTAEFETATPGNLIKTSVTGNGTIKTSSTKAESGTKVTITIEPESGYELSDGPTVTNDATSQSVSITEESEANTYSFTMPDAAVTIAATFTKRDGEAKVSKATTWTFDAVATLSGVFATEYKNAYIRDTKDATKWSVQNYTGSALTFSDGTSVTPAKYLSASEKINDSGASRTAGQNADKQNPTFALNSSVPGTVYAIVSPTSTTSTDLRIFFNDGTSITNSGENKIADGSTVEIKMEATKAGSFFIGSSDQPYSIYAVRFVPTDPANIKHDITVPAGVMTDQTEATVGTKVTLKVVDGYTLASGSTIKVNGGAVTLNSDNTFTMPAEAVTVSATFTTDPIYGTYDFVDYTKNAELASGFINIVTYANGDIGGSKNGNTMKLNGAFSFGDNIQLRYKDAKAGGLGIQGKKQGALSIKGLKQGDWFTMECSTSDALQFKTTNVRKFGATANVTTETKADSAAVYVVQADGDVSFTFSGGADASDAHRYIYRVTLSEDVILPSITDNGVVDGEASVTIKYPATYTLYYKVPGASDYTSTTAGSEADGMKSIDLKVAASGTVYAYTKDGSKQSQVVEQAVSVVQNVTLTLLEAKSDNTKKTYQVSNFKSGQTLYYQRPQDSKYNSQKWDSKYDTTPMEIVCTTNGELLYYVVEDKVESKHDAITVNTIITRPTATLKELGDTKSVYTLGFALGNTLYYTLPGGEEKFVDEGNSVDVDVTKAGQLKAYAKIGTVTSDTLKTNLYVKTPAIAKDGLYDFSLVKEKVGSNYALSTRPSKETVTIGGVKLTKPDDVVANTLDRFAFTARFTTTASDGKAVERNTDWRLLDAGRLRAIKSSVADTLAILDLKAGNYVTINYSGGPISYMSQSSAKLADGTTTVESQQAYEVLSDGGLLLVAAANTEKDCDIFTIQISDSAPVVPIIDNATLTLTDDTDKTKKVYTVSGFKSGQRLYFMRPQDTEWKYTGYSATYDTTPYTLTATTNGNLTWYLTETATGKTSKRDTIEVNTIITRPNATLKTLGDAKSVYKLSFSKGNTVYYTVPGGTQQTVSTGDSLNIEISRSGVLTAYARMGSLTSDTLKTNVYVKTPAIAVGGKYDFALLKDRIADYVVGTRPGKAITVGGLTLKQPDDVVENTLDRFAFTARYRDASGSTIRERDTDWRLLSAGRLRANKTAVTDTMAILRLSRGQFLSINYSGAELQYMSQSTAKLANDVTTLVSNVPYEILSDGDLLLRVPANVDKTCDIFVIEIAGEESVTAPSIEPRTESGVVVPNAVTLRLGTSNFGRKVTAYYTTDGSVPTTSSASLTASGKITVEESCVITAVCISESGIRSSVTRYTVTLPEAPNAKSVVYDIEDMVKNGETLEFSQKGVSVYYMENNNGWEMKSRSDFMPVLNLDSMISVRAGESSLVYNQAAGTMQLKRALAIHNLGVGDEIVIIYSGSGSLINVGCERGNEYTVNGQETGVAEEIPSGAVIKVTKTKYANNYVVVNVSGDVYIKAIYINSKAPEVVTRPRVTLLSVGQETATYRITFDEGARLYYALELEGAERKGTTTGTYDMTIDTSDRLSAWAQTGALRSDTLTAVIYAPTPSPSENGDYDFAEPSEELPADLEVTLDEKEQVSVGDVTLYKPTAMTSKTFDNKFAFEQTGVAGKIKIRTNRHLAFNMGVDMHMALLTMRRGDIIAFDYTGTIRFDDPTMVERDASALARGLTRAATEDDILEPGVAYVVTRDGNVLLTLDLNSEAVSIAKMFVEAAPEESRASAIDFATAAEEEEELYMEAAAMVWCHERTATVKFKRLANNSDELPISNKVSSENGYGSMTSSGFTSGNRNIAIHNLAKGDSIKVRFSGGDMLYYGHETYGNRVSVNGRQLMPGDTIHTGDVLRVEQVDYLNNYVVLRLGSKAAISGIFINTEEIEKVLMPVITTKANNTFVITGGKSTVGNEVTTVYTTNGTEPSEFNGTGGPYESFEVQVIKGRALTIKAVSYTESGACSRVVTVFYDGVNMTAIGGITTGEEGRRDSQTVYNLHGRRVKTPLPGRVYIINGKKVIYK